MDWKLITKFVSRKLGALGVVLAAIAAVPTPDPISTSVKLVVTVIAGVGYFFAQAKVDKADAYNDFDEKAARALGEDGGDQ